MESEMHKRLLHVKSQKQKKNKAVQNTRAIHEMNESKQQYEHHAR